MQKITVTPLKREQAACELYVGSGLIHKLGALYDLGRYSKVFIVTDETVQPLLLEELAAGISVATDAVVLPSGEREKHIQTVEGIWTAMHRAGCDRQSLVVNLGGGVVGDIGGFAASTYMRGIDFLNIPTTLLAQVDASVGGKTGFNFAGVKNLIGTFKQPIGVVIDVDTLASLPARELTAGFAEIIKHGLVWDSDYFERVCAKAPADFTPAELEAIIADSCRIKATIVEQDETEHGTRKLVNFGHTIGHAVEALSLNTSDPLLHGGAISIGMLAEAELSERQGLLSRAAVQTIENALTAAGLPTRLNGMDPADILQKMKSDKKNVSQKLNFTLLERIGKGRFNQTVPDEQVLELLRNMTQN